MKPAYYNEIDPFAAQTLRNLIQAGHIAAGDVDQRSIEDVRPYELRNYGQCHFFAGVGVWSYALRRAGWRDDQDVWTASCPCQPFSAAGQSGGFDDERHLWPHLHYLIEERRPGIVLGEQVASKDAEPWLDLVQDDVEGLGYAFGAVAFPAASVGAPHIRDRTYWVAHARAGDCEETGRRLREGGDVPSASGAVGRLGNPENIGDRGQLGILSGAPSPLQGKAPGQGYGDALGASSAIGDYGQPGPTNGLWAAADWLLCRDERWRPVEPGTFPLAHGAPARVGRLRAYGNAINAEAARVFIESVIDTLVTSSPILKP